MKRNGIKYKTIKEAHDAACGGLGFVEAHDDIELGMEVGRMRTAIKAIEEYVTPGPDGYRTIRPADTELMHLICCIARGGTIANGAIQPAGEDDDV